ncbi:hypothetical protein AB0D10_41695 [Kitasatospora sp. NPDC048545]
MEFLRERDPKAEWAAAEFTLIGTGDANTDPGLVDVVSAYLQWRDAG